MTTKTINTNELTDAQLLELIKSRGLDKKKAKTTVKMTDKGGLFVSLDTYNAVSERTNKPFQFGINIHAYQVEGFVSSVLDGSLAKALKTLGTK